MQTKRQTQFNQAGSEDWITPTFSMKKSLYLRLKHRFPRNGMSKLVRKLLEAFLDGKIDVKLD